MHLPRGSHVRVNGIRQHYLHYPGGGAQVVVVPGIVTPAILWDHVARALEGSHDCYLLDVRGRGLSEAGPHLDYGLDACAADVAAFARALELGPAIFVGHSMGARICLRMARQAPQSVRALVLVDPPTSGPGRRPYPVPMGRTLDLLRAAHRGEAAAALQAGGAALWPDDLQRLREEWLCTCDERVVAAAYEDFHGQDMFADLAAVAAPASLICADKGGVVSEADVREMRRLRPGLHAVRLEGAGHQMQAEDAGGFVRVLQDTLRRHEGGITRSQE